MPFIGDRYYMNPLFGAAVERSRVGDDVLPDEDSDSSGLHVELLAAQKQLQQPHSKTPPQTQEHKAEVGYGETSGLVPEKIAGAPAKSSAYDRRMWDENSARHLQEARTHIMDISERNPGVHRAKPDQSTISQAVWSDSMHAAANSIGSLPGKHFFIRQQGVGYQQPPKRLGWGQGKPIRTYGPFRNVGGGDVPKGNHTFIDIYNH